MENKDEKIKELLSGPTSKTLPVRGVGRGLQTSNSLWPQTAVPTVCPQIHHPATPLTEPYLIATNPFNVVGAMEGKTWSSMDFTTGNSPTLSVQLLAQQQQQRLW